ATVDDFLQRLRRFRTAEWVRLAGRALAHLGSTAQIVREHSELADAVLDACTRVLWRRARAAADFVFAGRAAASGYGFAVLAQGKLGAGELNVSSDVDLQYLCCAPAADGTAMAALCEPLARRLTQALSARDAHGFCYRVDLELRPEGKRGALVNSLAGAEHFYEAYGQSWERLALMRARPVGGARWVSQAFVQAMRPFVYPRSISTTLVDEMAALGRRIHGERRYVPLGDSLDLKRDPGGIRDVELFVQTLQHLQGGRQPSLQTPSTLEALDRLYFLGLLPASRHARLRRAYLLLRSVENAVQVVDERQAHRLPTRPEALAHLAAILGLRDVGQLQRRLV
ncbi:MAG: bifunctional [glutamate--ammonia ligase]-adenylyl-L-tyrosine phosphorylase/[glutamate--ammonia-ligase] adenylyltransferase, partial [Deltaproteobacteria bacterium]